MLGRVRQGWAVGVKGIILHTEDGNGAWRPLVPIHRVRKSGDNYSRSSDGDRSICTWMDAD